MHAAEFFRADDHEIEESGPEGKACGIVHQVRKKLLVCCCGIAVPGRMVHHDDEFFRKKEGIVMVY